LADPGAGGGSVGGSIGQGPETSPLGNWMEADHERLDALWEEARRSWPQDLARARDRFRAFREGLLRHIEAEETLLFPFYEVHGTVSTHHLTDFLREEHAQIRSALQKLAGAFEEGSHDVEGPETILRNVLWAHNTREEGLLYPWFDHSITEGEGHELSERIRAMLSKPPS
jgi:regulator of cell morphogenesis and NO signaling